MNEYNIYEQLSDLYFGVRKNDSSKDLKELFDFLRKFPKVAPFNLALASVQRPGAGYFASRFEWEKLGRTVKPEARPMVILRTFGPVEFVYDVSDTTGDPLPKEIERPFETKTNNPITNQEYGKLVSMLWRAGVKYATCEYGSQGAGRLTRLEHEITYCISKEKSKYSSYYYQITVNSYHSPTTMFATVAHELGHMFCGHLGTIPGDPWPDRSNSGLSLNQMEFEAESVCWLVCERRGIDNPSEGYLRGYLDGGNQIPQIDLGCILRAVTYIEAMRRGHFKTRDFLVRTKP